MARRTYSLEQLTSPMGLWRWTFGLTLAAMALDLALVGEVFGAYLTGASLRDRHLALAALGALFDLSRLCAGAALIVLVCRISYRVMRNLHILNPPVTLVGPAWAAGWHFVPIANFFMPYRAIRQMQRGSDAFASKTVASTESTGPWWGAWIVTWAFAAAVLGNHLQILAAGAWPDPALLDRALWLGCAAALAHFICAPFFLDVFGRLCRVQHELVAHAAHKARAEQLK